MPSRSNLQPQSQPQTFTQLDYFNTSIPPKSEQKVNQQEFISSSAASGTGACVGMSGTGACVGMSGTGACVGMQARAGAPVSSSPHEEHFSMYEIDHNGQLESVSQLTKNPNPEYSTLNPVEVDLKSLAQNPNEHDYDPNRFFGRRLVSRAPGQNEVFPLRAGMGSQYDLDRRESLEKRVQYL